MEFAACVWVVESVGEGGVVVVELMEFIVEKVGVCITEIVFVVTQVVFAVMV